MDGNPTNPPLNVLHLEDNQVDADFMAAMLEEDGVECRIEQVVSRDAFLDALNTRRFDLIISDYTLPSFDGMEALRLATRITPQTPFIFVSGTIGEEVAVKTLKDGAVDYVLKNRLSRFPSAVRRAIREAEQRAEREAYQRELLRRDELFRQITDNVDDMIAVLDLTGRRIFVSPSFSKVLGLPPEEIPTDSFADIHPEDRDHIRSVFQQTASTGIGQRAKYRLMRRDGTIRHIESQGSVIRDNQGAVTNVVVVSRDITESRQMEEMLLRSQRMETIGALAGGIAHDLNNVLSPVLMVADLLLDGDYSESDKRMLETVKTSALRGRDMVMQILSFAHGSQGEPMMVQMRHLIKDMVNLMEETFPRSIRIHTHLERNLRTVHGDPTQLHQILLNLCVNARDAMSEGGDLKIAARNAEAGKGPLEGSGIVVELSDTGCGMPESIRDKIFQPFFTTKAPGKGTGLGLSTVSTLVSNHGGSIELETEEGKGTTFRIYLPASMEELEVESTHDKPSPPRGNGEQVLLVDDEQAILLMIKGTLEAFNYRVTVAHDGLEALNQYHKNPQAFHLVITDLMMPSMDGATLIRYLHRLNPAIRVIATSGLVHAETDPTLVDAVLQKPYDSAQLLNLIRQVLDSPVSG